MSEQLAQATMEQPAPEAAGFMNRIYEAAREHPLIAKLAVGAGMLGAGGVAELAIADAAVAQPTAEMSSGGWTVLGGDPLVPGGVHSRSEFVNVVTSGKGQTAMKYAGLGTKERQAVTLATRKGQERSCSMPYGETFQKMSFGINGTSVDRNVTFADPNYINSPAPAFCVDAKVDVNGDGKVDEVVHIKMPEKCGNVALMNRTPVNHPKPHHPKREAPVSVVKVAKDSTGAQIPTPTGEFRFFAKCEDGNDQVKTTAIYNQAVQRLIDQCNVGSTVTVKELSPVANPNDWKFITPQVQKQAVRAKGNKFVFVDKEVGSTPAGPICTGDTTNTNSGNAAQGGNCSTNINVPICSPVNSPNSVICSPSTPPITPPAEKFPPTVNVEQKTPGFEGGDEQDVIVICATADSNPLADGVTVTAKDKYTGTLTVVKQGSTNEYCATDTLTNTPETDDDVTFTATDNVNGLTATDDTGNFSVRQPQ
jgi:hypothetical protein